MMTHISKMCTTDTKIDQDILDKIREDNPDYDISETDQTVQFTQGYGDIYDDSNDKSRDKTKATGNLTLKSSASANSLLYLD